MSQPFVLHPRLAADCHQLGDLPFSRLLLMNDRQYPWLILVPRKPEVREICELTEAEQQALLRESSMLSRALLSGFAAHKLNIAALGNIVPQLHLHHIARFPDDAAWPAPVWGRLPPQPYDEAGLAHCRARLAPHLPQDFRADFVRAGNAAA